MCGRYSIYSIVNEKPAYGFITPKPFKPHYNASPGQELPVFTDKGFELMHWGLIPVWAKDKNIGYTMVNARVEGIVKKPAYGRLLKSHRCVAPANSFFEWKNEGKTKQPMLISIKDKKTFYFAGLWDHWIDPTGKEVKSYTIITCSPNSFVSTIHDRMPTILEDDEVEPWLFEKEYINFDKMLDPYPNSQLTAYAVSTLVNRPSNDSPAVIEKLGS